MIESEEYFFAVLPWVVSISVLLDDTLASKSKELERGPEGLEKSAILFYKQWLPW